MWEANCTLGFIPPNSVCLSLVRAIFQRHLHSCPSSDLHTRPRLVIFGQLKLGQDESGQSVERKQVWCGGTVSPWQSSLSQPCLRLQARHALGKWPTPSVPLQLTVWQGAHYALNSEAWVHDDPPKQDPEPLGAGVLPGSSDAQGLQPPQTSQRLLWRVTHKTWRGLQPEWLLILTQHAHMSMYPWCCGSSASPHLGYGMGWLFAGAVGNEDEAYTEEKYSVLKHTFVRSPIVSIVTIKVRGSIKFCMHFLH